MAEAIYLKLRSSNLGNLPAFGPSQKMVFENFGPEHGMEGYSLEEKNLYKLRMKLERGQICEHFYDVLKEKPLYACFNPEDALCMKVRK